MEDGRKKEVLVLGLPTSDFRPYLILIKAVFSKLNKCPKA